MSLIERALERLKKEEAERRRETEPAVVKASVAAVPGIGAHQASATVPTPAHPRESPEVVPALSCRSDRTLNIDLQVLRTAGALAPASEERRLAEEYRNIKRPLLKTMTQGEPQQRRNLVAITSALPGEGKTFTSINLALSLAMERGRQVVLVDGDAALDGLPLEPQ